MENVEVLGGLSIRHGRGNFRSVTTPCIILGKFLHFSLRLPMGLLQEGKIWSVPQRAAGMQGESFP